MSVKELYELWVEMMFLLEAGASLYDEETDELADHIEDGFRQLLEGGEE